MNKSTIVKGIRDALRTGVEPADVGENANPDSYRTFVMRETQVETSPETRMRLTAVLVAEPDLAIFEGGMLLTGGGTGHTVHLAQLADWLLAQSLKPTGPEAAVEILAQFMATNSAPGYMTIALEGIELENVLQLTEDIDLRPFSELPPSYAKDWVLGIPVFVDQTAPERKYEPTAALVRHYEHTPVMRLPGASASTQQNAVLSSMRNSLRDVLRCLTLAGPSAPIEVVAWDGIVDQVPLGETLGGWNTPLHEIPPHRHMFRQLPPFRPDEASRLVNKFLGLDPRFRTALRIPLERLNLSMRRYSSTDRALDLGIALESLLLQGTGSREQLSLQLRLRGAWLYGSTDQLSKRDAYELLKDIYGLRSSAVHDGYLNDAKSTGKGPVKERLWRGIELCAVLIRRVIDLGRFPEWDKLLLGGS